jgi:alpha-D-ribose 1-methylphosphonate 5-triphosphate synthase subunit PhnG
MSEPISREKRAELLAGAGRARLIALAERCLLKGAPEVTLLPEVGTIALVVREPIVHDRLILADVLVTRAEVAWGGSVGWAMRPGDDRVATLAAAVCDAEVEAARPLAPEVEELCRATAGAQVAESRAMWAELAPTVVNFEEM